MLKRVGILMALLCPSYALADEPGVFIKALAGGGITVTGERTAVTPSMDVSVDGPLVVGSRSVARILARLRLMGLPGETVNPTAVETVRAAGLSLQLSRRVGRATFGTQEVWTSLAGECGFSTVLGGVPVERYPRHCWAGLRLEERQSGVAIAGGWGFHDAAGPRYRPGQIILGGSVPVRSIELGGDAILSLGRGIDGFLLEAKVDLGDLWNRRP